MEKVGNHNSFSKIFFFCLALMLSFSSLSVAQDTEKGKEIFNSNCAACHKLDENSIGPALRNIADGREVEWLRKWIKSSTSLVKSGDAEAVKVFDEWNKIPMPDFPGLSDEDIDNLLAYTSEPPAEEVAVAPVEVAQSSGSENVYNIVILVSLLIVLMLLVSMLYLVGRVLKKVVEAKGLSPKTSKISPLWEAFIKNKFLVLISVLFFAGFGSYFAFGYMMQVGVDKGYQPIQPIHFSHKIHAGDNGIDCKYCHSSARVSKTSGIPSLNVCMNCHESINKFKGDPGVNYGEYNAEFYTAEIQKLYDAVGWDASTLKYTGEEKPVKWVRIHNLQDFVYYNHSQHVSVAGLECQTCHGPVEEMEIMEQYSPLTMGWCIDCHRKTDVKMESNEYYAKIHEELSKKYGVEKLTVAQMGGLECGKCHY